MKGAHTVHTLCGQIASRDSIVSEKGKLSETKSPRAREAGLNGIGPEWRLESPRAGVPFPPEPRASISAETAAALTAARAASAVAARLPASTGLTGGATRARSILSILPSSAA